MSEPEVHIRADADRAIGAGHVMRCWALAEEMSRRGCACVLWTAACPEPLIRRFDGLGAAIRRLETVDSVPADLDGQAEAILILDRHHQAPAIRRRWSALGRPSMAFHDGDGEIPSECDVIVNAAAGASAADYRAAGASGTLLLGADYAPIRREFADARRSARPVPERDRVILTLGGSDPLGLALPLVTAVADALPADVALEVMTGGMSPSLPALRSVARERAPRVRLHVDTTQVAALMADAGLAIAAAGGTAGELACVGTPAILMALADNQDWIFADTHAGRWYAGLDGRQSDVVRRAATLARALWHDPDRRAAMSDHARSVVDGGGCARIADAVLAHARRCRAA